MTEPKKGQWERSCRDSPLQFLGAERAPDDPQKPPRLSSYLWGPLVESVLSSFHLPMFQSTLSYQHLIYRRINSTDLAITKLLALPEMRKPVFQDNALQNFHVIRISWGFCQACILIQLVWFGACISNKLQDDADVARTRIAPMRGHREEGVQD